MDIYEAILQEQEWVPRGRRLPVPSSPSCRRCRPEQNGKLHFLMRKGGWAQPTGLKKSCSRRRHCISESICTSSLAAWDVVKMTCIWSYALFTVNCKWHGANGELLFLSLIITDHIYTHGCQAVVKCSTKGGKVFILPKGKWRQWLSAFTSWLLTPELITELCAASRTSSISFSLAY